MIDHHAELTELQQVLSDFAALLPQVDATAQAIIDCLKGGGKVLSCGNGGSAADALHLAEEFVGRYKGDRPSLPAICLSADVTALTCIANDYGFDSIFSRAVSSLGQPGDVLVGFTTSGNSKNVLEAVKVGNSKGLITILLSGKGGGNGKGLPTHEIIVPSDTGARIQEVHTFILHQWLERVEAESW